MVFPYGNICYCYLVLGCLGIQCLYSVISLIFSTKLPSALFKITELAFLLQTTKSRPAYHFIIFSLSSISTDLLCTINQIVVYISIPFNLGLSEAIWNFCIFLKDATHWTWWAGANLLSSDHECCILNRYVIVLPLIIILIYGLFNLPIHFRSFY